jgi:hypothetical protein
MKLIIDTQYRENYGAHDWDGQGKCPQYWKNKFGDIYVIEGLELKNFSKFEANELEELKKLIEYSSEYSSNFIISYVLKENNEQSWEDYECPIFLKKEDGKWIGNRVIVNDGYSFRTEIKEKRENYVLKEGGITENYKVNYLLNDDTVVSSDEIEKVIKKIKF